MKPRTEKKQIAVGKAERNFRLTKPYVILLILALGFNLVGFLSISRTISIYNDIEASAGNLLAALILDFELDGTTWVTEEDAADLDPGDSITRNIKVVDANSIDFEYVVRAVQTSGDNDFCSELQLEAFLEGNPVYIGDLLSFISTSTTFGEFGDDWFFRAFIPSTAPSLNDKTCAFNFIYDGWQEEFLGLVTGYNDTEFTDNILSAGACVEKEVRSKGYWTTHEENWIFPQTLGNITIENENDASFIFDLPDDSQENKLKKQLLALKFNIAYFGVGGAVVPGESITISELAAEADALLSEDPLPADDVLEEMKNRVEAVNVAEAVEVCA